MLRDSSQVIQEELEKVLADPLLAAAPSLSRFLRYVVEEALAGRESALKEYSLGVSVFGRGEGFSPRSDPIVRVQARNLRTRLERYYAGPGAGDPLVIDLPKGSYVPVFHRRQPEPPSRKWLASATLAIAVLLALLGTAVVEIHRAQISCGPGTSRSYLAP